MKRRVAIVGCVLMGCSAPQGPRTTSTAAPSASVAASSAPVDTGPVIGAPVVMPGLSGALDHVRLSNDGKLLAATTWQGVFVVDAETLAVRGFKETPCASSLVFTGDGQRLAFSACGEPVLHVWDFADDSVHDVALSQAGATLSAGATGALVLAVTGTRAELIDVATRSAQPVPGGDFEGLLRGVVTKDSVIVIAKKRITIAARKADGSLGEARTYVPEGPVVEADVDAAGEKALLVFPNLVDLHGRYNQIVDLRTLQVTAAAELCQYKSIHAAFAGGGPNVAALCVPGNDIALFDGALAKLPKQHTRRLSSGQWLLPLFDGATSRLWIGERKGISIIDLAAPDAVLSTIEADGVPTTGGSRVALVGPRGLTVVDSNGASLVKRANAEPKRVISVAGDVLTVRGAAWEDFDVASRSIVPSAEHTDDGAVEIHEAEGSVRFQERGEKGKSWTIKTTASVQTPLDGMLVSRHGRFVFKMGYQPQFRTATQAVVVFGVAQSRVFSADWGSLAVSPTEDFIATRRQCHFGIESEDCALVTLTNLASFKDSTLEASMRGRGALAFSGTGKELADSPVVLDVPSGKLLWEVDPESEIILDFLRAGSVAVVLSRAKEDAGTRSLRFVDGRTGKELARAPYVEILGQSANGQFVVVADRTRSALVDVSSGAVKALPVGAVRQPPISEMSQETTWPVHVSNKGDFVWTSSGSFVIAVRVADGRILAFTDSGPSTPAGVVAKVDDKAPKPTLRRGPHVLRSPLEPLDVWPPELVQPGLEADFFAGK